MTIPIRASIYIKDVDLVEYLSSIPPSKRSSHIRGLLREDMNRTLAIDIDQTQEEEEIDQDFQEKESQGRSPNPQSGGSDTLRMLSKQSDSSLKSTKPLKTQESSSSETDNTVKTGLNSFLERLRVTKE